jgi:hypothetical protein
MSTDFLNDSDGDVLRRIASDGNEMSKPMGTAFAVAVPDDLRGALYRWSPGYG